MHGDTHAFCLCAQKEIVSGTTFEQMGGKAGNKKWLQSVYVDFTIHSLKLLDGEVFRRMHLEVDTKWSLSSFCKRWTLCGLQALTSHQCSAATVARTSAAIVAGPSRPMGQQPEPGKRKAAGPAEAALTAPNKRPRKSGIPASKEEPIEAPGPHFSGGGSIVRELAEPGAQEAKGGKAGKCPVKESTTGQGTLVEPQRTVASACAAGWSGSGSDPGDSDSDSPSSSSSEDNDSDREDDGKGLGTGTAKVFVAPESCFHLASVSEGTSDDELGLNPLLEKKTGVPGVSSQGRGVIAPGRGRAGAGGRGTFQGLCRGRGHSSLVRQSSACNQAPPAAANGSGTAGGCSGSGGGSGRGSPGGGSGGNDSGSNSGTAGSSHDATAGGSSRHGTQGTAGGAGGGDDDGHDDGRRGGDRCGLPACNFSHGMEDPIIKEEEGQEDGSSTEAQDAAAAGEQGDAGYATGGASDGPAADAAAAAVADGVVGSGVGTSVAAAPAALSSGGAAAVAHTAAAARAGGGDGNHRRSSGSGRSGRISRSSRSSGSSGSSKRSWCRALWPYRCCSSCWQH